MGDMNLLRLASRGLTYPARLVGRAVYRVIPHNRRLGHFVIGIVLIFVGAAASHIESHLFPHFVIEGVAYSIHGIGLAPIIENILPILFGE